MGAIGMGLLQPVFSLAESTSKQSVIDFFMKLYSVINPNPAVSKVKTVVVLDNHMAHKTNDVKILSH